jgi:hypothetical protein
MDVKTEERGTPIPARPQTGAERRKSNLLLLHWQSLRAGRPYPALADVVPEAIPALWRFCFVAEARAGALVFSYIGHAVNRGYGMGEGPQAGGISVQLMRVVEGPCEAVRVRAQPELFEGDAPNQWGDVLRYRGCACPLSDDGLEVTHIFGLIDYIEMKREVVRGVQIETDINPDET